MACIKFHQYCGVNMQVGFLVRIEGQRLTADLEECYPDYEFAFEAEDEGVRGMYYRCERTRELQAEFGDMLHRIHDLEAGHIYPCSPKMSMLKLHETCRQTWGTCYTASMIWRQATFPYAWTRCHSSYRVAACYHASKSGTVCIFICTGTYIERQCSEF